MRILLEGNEDQIKAVKRFVEINPVMCAQIVEGKQIRNVWAVEDVRSTFECTEEEALEVLEQALTNEATMRQIWYAIDFHGEDNGLKRI